MSELVEKQTLDPSIIASIVLAGDLSRLNDVQQVQYYNYRCAQIGIDPSAKPFDILILNGKKILYANASATQQLSSTHGLSIQIINRERIETIYCVTVRVTGRDQRSTENQGAVDLGGQSGERLANAIMKAATKAIRRTVLAHCGLGMLDETEVETIPGAEVVKMVVPQNDVPTLSAALKTYSIRKPDGEVYSSHNSPSEFVGGFFDLVGRIAGNSKLSNEEKNAKLVGLFQSNQQTVDTLKPADKSAFLGQIAAHRVHEQWRASKDVEVIIETEEVEA